MTLPVLGRIWFPRCGHSVLTARRTCEMPSWPYASPRRSRLIFPIAGSVDGNWRHSSSVTSSVSNLPATGALTQEIKPWMPCLSEEVIKSFPGGRFHGFIYHPDLRWVSWEEKFPKPPAIIWASPSCFDHSLVIIRTLWAAGFDSIMLIHFPLRRYITVARSFR